MAISFDPCVPSPAVVDAALESGDAVVLEARVRVIGVWFEDLADGEAVA